MDRRIMSDFPRMRDKCLAVEQQHGVQERGLYTSSMVLALSRICLQGGQQSTWHDVKNGRAARIGFCGVDFMLVYSSSNAACSYRSCLG